MIRTSSVKLTTIPANAYRTKTRSSGEGTQRRAPQEAEKLRNRQTDPGQPMETNATGLPDHCAKKTGLCHLAKTGLYYALFGVAFRTAVHP